MKKVCAAFDILFRCYGLLCYKNKYNKGLSCYNKNDIYTLPCYKKITVKNFNPTLLNMQFPRTIEKNLHEWSKQPSRKPLILRGARQVGKTVVGKMFGNHFDTFIYLNLDKEKKRLVFQKNFEVSDIYQALLLDKKISSSNGTVLLFLDEIQECPEAVEYLRYFYEELPELYVMAAGSLLEIALEKEQISFPVGRVEHRFMYPLSFSEFLHALGTDQILSALETIPFPAYAYDIVKGYFERYTLIGGMPEIVAAYIKTEDLTMLPKIYDSLLISYVLTMQKNMPATAPCQPYCATV